MKNYVPQIPDVRSRSLFPAFGFCFLSLVRFLQTMAASRLFAEVSDADLVKFLEENENENTAKKTEYDLRIFREYLAAINEQRDIETLPFSELQNILMKFILAVKKNNGEDYEPSSIRASVQSIDRYLKRNNHGSSILHDREFSQVQDILKISYFSSI